MTGSFPYSCRLKSFHNLGIETQIMTGSCAAMSSLATSTYPASFRTVLANFMST